MGCDIHMYTEVKRSIRDKDTWVNVDDFRVNPYYDGKEEGKRQYEHQDLHGDRNYSLFTLLAGVRDYSGKSVPVSDPKGLPEDMSETTKEFAEHWDSDGHTHSWLTLTELKKYQANQPAVTHSGLISQRQAKELDENGKFPQSWCQGSSDDTMVRREWTEPDNSLQPLIHKMQERLKDAFWIYGDNYDAALDEKIRIVFWFDN